MTRGSRSLLLLKVMDYNILMFYFVVWISALDQLFRPNNRPRPKCKLHSEWRDICHGFRLCTPML